MTSHEVLYLVGAAVVQAGGFVGFAYKEFATKRELAKDAQHVRELLTDEQKSVAGKLDSIQNSIDALHDDLKEQRRLLWGIGNKEKN